MHDTQSTAAATRAHEDVQPFGRDTRRALAPLNKIGVVALLAWAAFVYASYLLGLRG
jgi:hypothetical protein